MITIAIPIYNAEKYLAESIQSVLSQTFTEFELLLIDDGSTDRSVSICRSFDDPRIRIFVDGINRGLPNRLNQAVQLSKFDFIARMDSDDIIPANRLAKQYAYLKTNPQYDLVTMEMAYVTNDLKVTRHSVFDCSKRNLNDMLNGNSGIKHATLLVRKEWYERNIYDESMERVEDYELWLRAYLKNDLNIGFLSDIGYFYRSDVTLSLSKYLRTFESLRNMALNLNLPIGKKVKFITKQYVKSLLVYFLFKVRLEHKFLSKNAKLEEVTKSQELLYQTLKGIKNV